MSPAKRIAFIVLTVMAVWGSVSRSQVVPPALPKAATKPSATRPAAGPHALVGDFLGTLDAGVAKLRLASSSSATASGSRACSTASTSRPRCRSTPSP